MKKSVKLTISSLPLFVALFLLVYIKTSQEIKGAEFMSPVDNGTIITSLVVFILGYLCFLILMFFEDIKSCFIRQKPAK